VTNTPLISLCFDQPVEDVTKALSKFVSEHAALFVDAGASHGTRDQKLVFEGLAFELRFAELHRPPAASGTIFYSGGREQLRTSLSVDFANYLAGAFQVPALAKAYLELVMMLARALNARLIYVQSADLIIGTEYFVESVEGYLENGPFPALALIAFDETGDAAGFRTRGLAAFCGQELAFVASGLPQSEMMRRVVRLVHDMASGGPIRAPETLADLDPARVIDVIPDADHSLVTATLRNGPK